ncbi:MAG TPA: hypothetical protein DF613_09755 [Lachnospiraceae bacterium]|nr:hypothetical protein [Lachnospiraceae bacterium]
MGYGEYESYYIREEELLLLLAGQGMTGCCLPAGTDTREAENDARETEAAASAESEINSREDVYRILAGLYKKSYIEWEGDAVRLLEPAASLVRLIRDAGWCLQIEGDADNADGPTVKGCYGAGSRRVLLETSPMETGMLRFSLWKAEDLLEHLWEAGLFPEETPGPETILADDEDSLTKSSFPEWDFPEADLFAEQFSETDFSADLFSKGGFPAGDFPIDTLSAGELPEEDFFEDLFPEGQPSADSSDAEDFSVAKLTEELSEEEFRRTQYPRCTATLRDKTTGGESARLTVADQGLFTWTVLQEGGRTKRDIYKKENCKNILRGWFLREARS